MKRGIRLRAAKLCKRCGATLDPFAFSHDDDCIVKHSPTVQQRLEHLWFVFGHNGPKATMANHKFIQRHVEGRDHLAKQYRPTAECRKAVKAALADGVE